MKILHTFVRLKLFLYPFVHLKQVLLLSFRWKPHNAPEVIVFPLISVRFNHAHDFPFHNLQRQLNSFLRGWEPFMQYHLNRLLLFAVKK